MNISQELLSLELGRPANGLEITFNLPIIHNENQFFPGLVFTRTYRISATFDRMIGLAVNPRMCGTAWAPFLSCVGR